MVAVLRVEADGPALLARLNATPSIRISAGTLIELTTVIIRNGLKGGLEQLDLLLDVLAIEVMDVDREQALAARKGYASYGRGTGHPAKLNFGDCFAYALAKVTGEALLFKGDDFARTDIVAAAS